MGGMWRCSASDFEVVRCSEMALSGEIEDVMIVVTMQFLGRFENIHAKLTGNAQRAR
jgi:hypothetical protein